MTNGKKKSQIDPTTSLSMVRRVISDNLQAHVGQLTLAILCMLMVAAATSSIAWLMRSMVNGIFVEGQRQAIWTVGGSVMLAFLAKGVAGYFQSTLMGSIGASIVASLQKKQFQKLMSLDLAYYAGAHPAKFVGKMLHSARAARSIVVLISTNLFRDVMTLIGLGIVMLVQDPVMTLLALCGAPIVVLGISRIVKLTRESSKHEADIVSNVTVSASEAIQGMRVVKAFNLEDEMNRRVSIDVDQMEVRSNKLNKITSLTSPMMDIFGGLVVGSFILYAGWQTLSYGKTPGEFMAFITAFLLAYEPAKRLANFQVQLQRHLVAVGKMYKLLDAEIPENNTTSIQDFKATRSHLRFEGVAFSYTAGRPILHGITFEVEPGQKLALVGRSGAGKSTILNLMLGIHRVDSGEITIDDVALNEIRVPSLRANISYVSQDTFLFSGTIRENILFGQTNASEEDVLRAAAAAEALEFILALPNGFDTTIGDNGSQLSGGQRQRIAIARALIKSAPILLLDEATSALDGETERAIKRAQHRLEQGRTTIMIAHRLSTIIEADKVIVLDQGQIVAEGTHAELARSSPIYQSLFHNGEYLNDEDNSVGVFSEK